MSQAVSHSAFNSQLKKYYTFYTGGFIAFLIFLAIAEQMGMSRQMIGYIFLAATSRSMTRRNCGASTFN